MEENLKPNVFPQDSQEKPSQPKETLQPPQISPAEQQMIENREREMRERNIAKSPEQTIQPVLPGTGKYEPIVEPDFDSDWDMVPLPSGGKTYKNKKSHLKVSFLNASDENILSNPNLLKSGKFLEILFARKILDTSISYNDLLIGDRDAIMVWLRSTGHGSTYPIEVMDPKEYEMFNVNIDLDDLDTKNLNLEPDEEGYFDFTLPLSGKKIKFKMFTVGDAEDFEKHEAELEKNNGIGYDLATYKMERQIIEVDGNRDPSFIKSFIHKLRLGDSRALKKYVIDNECGIDLNITVQAPGGGVVNTYFPLNPAFFWPKL